MPFATHSLKHTSGAAWLFLLCAAWIVLANTIASELSQWAPALWQDLLRYGIAAGLLFCGFFAVARTYVSDLRPLSSVGFVQRPGFTGELGRGLALGWAIAIAIVLPALVTGNLRMTLQWTVQAFTHTILSVLVLTAFALTLQLVLAGLPVRMLLRASSPGWTVAAVLLVSAVLSLTRYGFPGSGGVLFSALAAAIFVTGFVRTRAVWLSLGIQMGWTVALQMGFGAPSPYTPVTYGLVQSDIGGPVWLTGGPFGPEASSLSVLVLILALIVLFRISRDYAWHYTWESAPGAGYALDIAPPAEHLREEAKHAANVPLVQIDGIKPASSEHPGLTGT